jgi:hypothetical protein
MADNEMVLRLSIIDMSLFDMGYLHIERRKNDIRGD